MFKRKKTRNKSIIREYTEIIVLAVALALFVRTFFVQAFRIPSESMEDTLLVGDFLFANKRLDGIAGASGQQDANRLGRAPPGLTQRFESAHTRQVLGGDNHVDWRFAQRVQRFAAGGRTVHCIPIAEPVTQTVQGSLFAVQQQHLRSEFFQRHPLTPAMVYVESRVQFTRCRSISVRLRRHAT